MPFNPLHTLQSYENEKFKSRKIVAINKKIAEKTWRDDIKLK